jgi:hypothetical protein
MIHKYIMDLLTWDGMVILLIIQYKVEIIFTSIIALQILEINLARTRLSISFV